MWLIYVKNITLVFEWQHCTATVAVVWQRCILTMVFAWQRRTATVAVEIIRNDVCQPEEPNALPASSV